MEKSTNQRVDQNEIRTHQIFVITGLMIGFITDQWSWIAAQSIIFLITFLKPSLGPYVLIYKKILVPLGLVSSDVRVDVPQAHQFTMGIGFVVAASASYFLYMGHSALGWSLVWLVVTLGAIALAGWCVGCFSYYMLNRLGLGGFFKHRAIAGIFPGARPGK